MLGQIVHRTRSKDRQFSASGSVQHNADPPNIFHGIMQSTGLVDASPLNPSGMLNNCVSVTLANLLKLKTVYELWDMAGVVDRSDRALSLHETYNLFLDLNKSLIFQASPSRSHLEVSFAQVSNDLNSPRLGVVYSRPNGTGSHCVVYEQSQDARFISFADNSSPFQGRFLDYQTDGAGKDVTSEVEESDIQLSFALVDARFTTDMRNAERVYGENESAPARISRQDNDPKTKKLEEIYQKVAKVINLLSDAGKLEQAELLAEILISLSICQFGFDHVAVLYAISRLGAVYVKQGHRTEALELQQAVVNASLDLPLQGQRNEASAELMWQIVAMHETSENWESAVLQMKATIDHLQKSLKEDPLALGYQHRLAIWYRDHQRWLEAQELLQDMITTSCRLLGECSEETLDYMYSLALVYKAQQNYEDAELQLRQVVAVQELLLTDDSDSILALLSSMNQLCWVLYCQEKFEESIIEEHNALDICKQKLGSTHEKTLVTVHNLACSYAKSERYEDAAELMLKNAEDSCVTLGFLHPAIPQRFSDLVRVLESLGCQFELPELGNARIKDIGPTFARRDLGLKLSAIREKIPWFLNQILRLRFINQAASIMDSMSFSGPSITGHPRGLQKVSSSREQALKRTPEATGVDHKPETQSVNIDTSARVEFRYLDACEYFVAQELQILELYADEVQWFGVEAHIDLLILAFEATSDELDAFEPAKTRLGIAINQRAPAVAREIVNRELDFWTQPSTQDAYFLDILEGALYTGNLEIFDDLLNSKSFVTRKLSLQPRHLSAAVASLNVELVRRILEIGVNIDSEIEASGRTALGEAACSGILDVCQFLLESGANPDIADHEGYQPLDLAAYFGHFEVVKLLAEIQGPQCVNIAAGGAVTVRMARLGGHFQIVKHLLSIEKYFDVERWAFRSHRLLTCQHNYYLLQDQIGAWNSYH